MSSISNNFSLIPEKIKNVCVLTINYYFSLIFFFIIYRYKTHFLPKSTAEILTNGVDKLASFIALYT